MNLTGDPDLENMRREVRLQLGLVDVKKIRSSETVREQTAQTAQQIMDKMGAFMK